MLSAGMSLVAFTLDPFRNVLPALRGLASPFLHADYLHLCLNIFGGFLVLNHLEAAIGKKRSLIVILFALITHISIVWGLSKLNRAPFEVLGLSGTIFTALGFLLFLNFSKYKTPQKISIFLVILLMVLVEVSRQTIVVHSLGIILGCMLSLFLFRLTDRH
jgi:membrane associated rhomboid family serine protease